MFWISLTCNDFSYHNISYHNSCHDDVARISSQCLIFAVNDGLLDDADVLAGRQEPLGPVRQLVVVLLR